MYVTSRVFYDQFQTDCTAIATWFKIILECLDFYFILNLGV